MALITGMKTPELSYYPVALRVSRVALSVRLGCGEDERAKPQAVEVDVDFYFPSVTQASLTDEGDFICYGKLSEAFAAYCEQKEFKLIEFLGLELYNVARGHAPSEVKIALKLTKCKVPVNIILGGASFSYTDLPPNAFIPPV